MPKPPRGPHLLEAFRGREKDLGSGESAHTEPVAATPGPVAPREVYLGKRPFLIVHVSASMLTAVIVGLVALCVVVFVLGGAVGRAPAEPAEETPVGSESVSPSPSPAQRRARLPAAVSPTVEQPTEGVSSAPLQAYAVQVATYKLSQRALAEELQQFLLTRGVPRVQVVVVGNSIVVYAGKFRSRDDSLAKELLAVIRAIEYRNSNFQDAYITKFPGNQ